MFIKRVTLQIANHGHKRVKEVRFLIAKNKGNEANTTGKEKQQKFESSGHILGVENPHGGGQ